MRPRIHAILTCLLAIGWIAMGPATSPFRACAGTVDPAGPELYAQLQQFQLSGASAAVENLTLTRDRVTMTFSGRFFFEVPTGGGIHSAVFIGRGTFRAEPPPDPFEKEHLRRLLEADTVTSDFQTAVLRFTDDTFDLIGPSMAEGVPVDERARELAREFGSQLIKETGANIAARLAESMLNNEKPGFFVAQFDGGQLDRFTFLMDHQGRIPADCFTINGGEKGLVFRYHKTMFGNDVWLAFFSQDDYARGEAQYADAFEQTSIERYTMDVDLHDGEKMLRLDCAMDLTVAAPGLQAATFLLNENLSTYSDTRRKKAMKVESLRLADGTELPFVQEDWQKGLLVFLPPTAAGDKLTLQFRLAGEFMHEYADMPCYFPLSTTCWYPRCGYLNRSRYDLTFRHKDNHRVVSVGRRLSEEADPEHPGSLKTRWVMDQPIPMATFSVGRLERHEETITLDDRAVSVEFYAVPKWATYIKEDFVRAELGNTVKYFHTLFGPFPYPKIGAVFYPTYWGQGFPSLLLLPRSDRSSKYTYSFIAHECSHQWWGGVVGWRSYRDQWLSEGFAEYSGILYTAFREKNDSWRELIGSLRRALKDPPRTETGVGKGMLTDIGPLILGHRLATSESLQAYSTLIYDKGALVLRMLHFLFSDPATGQDDAFFEMMRDFVVRHRDGWATTDSFIATANQHFVRTPIARKYKLSDLNWFFRQWVYQTPLPKYRMEYRLEKSDQGVILSGTVYQENAPDDWFMPLPLLLEFGKDQFARGTVHVQGPQTDFRIPLPAAPRKVELDPNEWILSADTQTKKR